MSKQHKSALWDNDKAAGQCVLRENGYGPNSTTYLLIATLVILIAVILISKGA